jgi:DNA-binding transcriptional LysR family regulator
MQWTDRIGRRVKLRDLHVLLAVAQSGSMARAAERLAISQPVVSKTIADLEHALGVRLLDRTSHGIEPTAYGLSFIHCGTAVFDELRRGVQEIEFLSDPTVGEVRIGGAAVFTDVLVPAAIARLAARYPRIEFHVTSNDTATACRMLRERKLDLVIGRIPGSMFADDLAADALFEERLPVVAGPGSRWLRRRKIDLGELAGEAWVFPEADTPAREWFDESFRSAGVATPKPQVVSNSIAVRARLVETGRFLTMLPTSTLHFGAAWLRVKILPVSTRMTTYPMEIITLKNRTRNPIATLLIDELRVLAEGLTKNKKAKPA